MSAHPNIQAPPDPGRLPMTLPLLREKKRLGDPIVMITAYDYPSARAAEAAGVDLVLVGDSAATTVLGHNATTPVELEEMLVLARAVRRGLRTPLLIGDLPFGSYEVSDEQAICTAMRMVKKAGCEVVKLEGGGEASVRRGRGGGGGGGAGVGPGGGAPPGAGRGRRSPGPEHTYWMAPDGRARLGLLWSWAGGRAGPASARAPSSRHPPATPAAASAGVPVPTLPQVTVLLGEHPA